MEKRILILDNYDSFTYNLFHLIQKITDSKIDVIRNDKIELDDVVGYDKIIYRQDQEFLRMRVC